MKHLRLTVGDEIRASGLGVKFADEDERVEQAAADLVTDRLMNDVLRSTIRTLVEVNQETRERCHNLECDVADERSTRIVAVAYGLAITVLFVFVEVGRHWIWRH